MNIYRSDKKGAGVGNYPDLTNLPQINGNTLTGNKTSTQLGIITKSVDDLVNYYLKTETYSSDEIDELIETLVSTRFEVVQQLPTVDIKTNVIYLVPSQSSSQGHVKDEWINLDGTTAGWEQIGSTAIDLSNYVTTTALNATLTAYVTNNALQTALQSYVTSTDLATTLSDYVTSTDLENYITDTDLEEALESYTTTEDLEDMLDEKQGVFQLASMPTPSEDYAIGAPYQYIGSDTQNYKNGYWYECKLVNGSYAWVNVKVQDGDTIQVTSMPTASSDYVSKVLQYIGATTQDYKQGYFYRCVNNSGTYSWVNQPVQDGETMQFSTLPSPSSELENKVVQFVGTSDNFYTNSYFYKCVNDNGTYKWVNVPVQDSETIQVESLPTASVDTWKMVVMYIGATTSTLKHNHWYECVSDGESTPTYSWVEVNERNSIYYEQTLSAGETNVIFAIPTSGTYIVDIYTSTGVKYSNLTIIGGYITLTYPSQTNNITVYCELRETISVVGEQLYDVASDVTIQTDQYKTINAVLEIKDNNWSLNLLFQNLSNVARFNITIDMSAYLSNSSTYTRWENVGEGRVAMAGGIKFTNGVLILKTFDGNDGSVTKPEYNNVIFYGTV